MIPNENFTPIFVFIITIVFTMLGYYMARKDQPITKEMIMAGLRDAHRRLAFWVLILTLIFFWIAWELYEFKKNNYDIHHRVHLLEALHK